jgi:predicted aminopeptidase
MAAKKVSFALIFSLILSIALGALTGCADLSYYLHSINGHMSIINSAQDIDDLLADENTDAELADRLRLVGRIRQFAVQQLQLPESGSYTIYADLKRSYALKNLFAAPEFSVEAHHWCYPIVGCAGYRGYFDEARLQKTLVSLKQQGFDTYVSNVSAYSTLGWFDDPVLNTFINWPDYRLAGMIFHELSHQQLYIDGDTEFNESFAVAVQQAGIKQWLHSNGDAARAARYQQQLDNRQQVIKLIKNSQLQLKDLYAQDIQANVMRQSKNDIIHNLKRDYKDLSSQFAIEDGFRRWFEGPVNNARLVSISTYYDLVPAFLQLLESHDGNFPAFFKHVENIGKLPDKERKDCLRMWNSGLVSRPSAAQTNQLVCLGR